MSNVKHKRLRDIRCFYSEDAVVQGSVRYLDFHSNYQFLFYNIYDISAQILCELRLHDFYVTEFNHLFLFFTPTIPHKQVREVDFKIEWWDLMVECGLYRDTWNKLDEEKKYDLLIDIISQAIKLKADKKFFSLIDKISSKIKHYKAELETTVFIKDAKKYLVTVKLKLGHNSSPPTAHVYYENKVKLSSRKLGFIELNDWNDIYFLCGKISVDEKEVSIFPKTTKTAKLITKAYPNELKFNL